MASIPSTDEQNFLVTLQECLQADNEKRTAAEVRASSSVERLSTVILSGDLSRYPGRTKSDSAHVDIAKYRLGYTGERDDLSSMNACKFFFPKQLRAFSAVLLRRLFQTQFENFWPKYSPDQQTALKKELLSRITQLDDDENIRKKICFIVAELARNLMGNDEFTCRSRKN